MPICYSQSKKMRFRTMELPYTSRRPTEVSVDARLEDSTVSRSQLLSTYVHRTAVSQGKYPVEAGLLRDIRIRLRSPRPVAPPMSLLSQETRNSSASSFAFIHRLDHRLRSVRQSADTVALDGSIDISRLDCGLHPRFHGNFPIIIHFTSDRTATKSMFTALHLLEFNVDPTKDPIWYYYLKDCRNAFQTELAVHHRYLE